MHAKDCNSSIGSRESPRQLKHFRDASLRATSACETSSFAEDGRALQAEMVLNALAVYPGGSPIHLFIIYEARQRRKKKQTEWAKGEVRSCTVRRRRRRRRRGHGRTREKSGSFFRGRLSLFKEIVARARFIHREREMLHFPFFLSSSLFHFFRSPGFKTIGPSLS